METEQSGSGHFEPPDYPSTTTDLVLPGAGGSSYGLSILLDSEKGWDLEFVPERDQKYDCPICLSVLREPSQTECGHRFCRSCILKWLRESEPRCPVDNMHLEESSVYPDNFAKREILALNVKCPNHTKGCDQILVLKHVQGHLEESCEYGLTPCRLLCANVLLRKDVEHHLKYSCPKRIVHCQQCGESTLAEDRESHASRCPLTRTECRHCGKELLRHQLKQHLDEECPEMVVPCQYQFLGCSFQDKRSTMTCHDTDFTQFHMSLLNKGVVCILKGMNIGPLEQQRPTVPSPSALGSLPTQMSVMSLGVAGEGRGSASFPSFFAPSHSANLSSSVSLLQQLFQQKAISSPSGAPPQTLSPSPASHPAPTESRASLMSGETKLVFPAEEPGSMNNSSESTAATRNPSTGTQEASEVEYSSKPSTWNQESPSLLRTLEPSHFHSFKCQNDLQDESLARHDQTLQEFSQRHDHHDRVYKDLKQRLRLLENTVNEFEGRCGNGYFLWKIKNYRKLRREAEKGEMTAIHSIPFYSGFYGYRMCIRVNLNGVDTAKGTHLSLFIHFMQGEYDDQLEWPFSGRIILTVLDQNPHCPVRRHISETLMSKPTLAAFQKPVNPRNHKGFGYMEFLPLSVIDSSSSTYVMNDALVIRAQIVPNSPA